MEYIISEEELMKFNEFYDVKNYLKSLHPVELVASGELGVTEIEHNEYYYYTAELSTKDLEYDNWYKIIRGKKIDVAEALKEYDGKQIEIYIKEIGKDTK